jgi:GNAT superfamily N-acetyltransferase
MGGDHIQLLRSGDAAGAAAATALLSQELGAGLYRPEWLLEDAANPAARVWVAGSPPIAGTAVARLLAPQDGEYYRGFGPAAMDLFAGAGTVGSFEAFAVDPGARGRGLGSRLVSASLDWMREERCAAAITLSWRSGRGGASAGLFRRLGMREGPTVERFYYEESVRDGWTCPVCGGPCECSATLFTLPLHPHQKATAITR